MKKPLLIALMFLTINSLIAQQEIPAQTNQIIIRFKTNLALNKLQVNQLYTGDKEVDRIISANSVQNIRKMNTGKKSDYSAVVVKINPDADFTKMLEELNKLSTVDYAEPDFIGQGSGVEGGSPNDTYYSRQWSLKNDGSFTAIPAKAGADIDMEEAWALEEGDSTVIVGILDTGCKLNHPELQNRIWKNKDEIPGNGIDEGNNNFIDDIQGWDFAYGDNNPTDDFGHGTNVTGIVGANGNNGIGYTGVDRNCKLMILKVLDKDDRGYYSWWSDAIHYAVDNGAKVLNMSLGGTDVSSTLKNAVNYALDNNVTIVACMMNTNSNTAFYPAAYPGVIAVGATNPDDKRSNPFFWSSTSGSNYGSHISVVAPGNYIYGLQYQSNTNYGTYWGGTSQATPHVAGLASLLLAQNPALTPAQIKTVIQNTAEDKVGDPLEDKPGWDQYYGYGRINARNALLLVSGVSDRVTNDRGFSIYPNPNDGEFNVDFKVAFRGKMDATITNILGKIVYHAELQDQHSGIRISSIPGIYILNLRQGNVTQSAKFIIR